MQQQPGGFRTQPTASWFGHGIQDRERQMSLQIKGVSDEQLEMNALN